MKLIVLFIVFTNLLFSSVIVEDKIFKQKDGVDILILLDSKFDGEIIKEVQNDTFVKYKITNISLVNKLEQDIKYQNIQSIAIIPNSDNSITLSISTNTKHTVEFTKIAEIGSGLKFSVKTQSLLNEKKLDTLSQTKQSDIEYSRYFTIVIIMAILIIILVVIKRKVEGGVNFGIKVSKQKAPPIEVIYQKGIDMKTKVSLIKINNTEYLILSSPSSNILLDKFEATNTNSSQQRFNEILSDNEKNLKDILNQK